MSTEPDVTVSSKTPFDRKYYSTLAWYVIPTILSILALAFLRAQFARNRNWVDTFPWQAAGGLVVGEFTLITFLFNREQQQRHFDAKQKADREFYERKAQADEFSDILTRFSNDKPVMRANAAIRLAEMAETHRPGSPETITPENYPFFPRATSQLSAALHMESDDAVRAEVVKALIRMTMFAKKHENETLKLMLVNEIADANRAAKMAFIKAIAAYMAKFEEIDEETAAFHEDEIKGDIEHLLRNLSIVMPFCSNPQADKAWQNSLMETSEYKAAMTLCLAVRKASSEEDLKKQNHLAIETARSCAARIVNTQSTLYIALKGLKEPEDLINHAIPSSDWQRPIPIFLNDCFLAGMSFDGLHLEGAMFLRADLQGAAFAMANLRGANFNEAHLQNAMLDAANLQGASLNGAEMQEARFAGAFLGGASLIGAKVQGTVLKMAKLEKACLGNIVCVGKCSYADLGADFGKCSKGDLCADFTDATWYYAQLRDRSGAEDNKLREWLQSKFPAP